MLEPHYLQQIADGAEQIASELHEYIIRQIVDRMMLRIGRGEDYLFTSSDHWRIQILQDAGYLLEDITAELSKYTRLQEKEIREAMEDAGVKALEYDDKIYQTAGLSPMPLMQSPALIRLMERNYLATLGEWNNYTRSTVEATQRLFLKECDIAYNKVMSGAVSYNQAVREAIEAVVSNGVYVEYPSGHRDTIETATARAVRTGIAQAAGDISLKCMEEMDWDIILVSAHIGARTGDGGQNPGNHLWWQGQFYSRTGKDRRFPPFSQTGYGTGEGLCGWNCRHSFGSGDGVNNPYADIQTEDNIRLEKLEQRQRALERRIRKTKREVMGLQEAVNKCQDEVTKNELQQTLNRKFYTLQRQNKAYRDFCKDNDLRQLPERIQIAKRRMEQAAKARRQSKPEKSVAKASGSDIIKPSDTKEAADVHLVGKIDRKIYSCIAKDIVTDEVIITDNQIQHIMDRHPNDYERFSSYFAEIVSSPDFIIESPKPNTALILKEIVTEREVFKTVLRLVAAGDNPQYKNSIITFMKIDEKEWNRLLRNKKILYKKE